ncbi:MAG: LirA/MavJ family T4SS effector [Pseudomonadota bacterium]
MTEYNDKATALKALETNNMRLYSKRPLDYALKDYLDGYATICEFLSDTARFETALNHISMRMWSAYRRDPSISNKFTRALSVVGSENGFYCANGHLATVDSSRPMKFKLTGGDKELGYFLRNRLFWKDSMEAQHGEHSHSLQWLAISAAKLKTKIPITELYARSGDLSMTTVDKDQCRAWAWIADCFPVSMSEIGDATKLAKGKDTLTTKSYRSPQNIMNFLLKDGKAIKNHFVSEYLFRRYNKHKWFKSGEGTRAFGGSIGGAARAKSLSDAGTWKVSSRVTNRLIRTDFSDPRMRAVPDPKKSKKYKEEVKFHGVDGTLLMSF